MMATKILPFGVMVIDGDTHVSKWVEQAGTLRIAEKYLKPFQKYVPVGGTVVDAGAMIGDHTVTYADWVGENGRVICFEPNSEAFECLRHNTVGIHHSVTRKRYALSDSVNELNVMSSENSGASYVYESDDEDGDVVSFPLDYFKYESVDFLKLDIEGFETRALRGARETIARCKPVMLIEVNEGALVRAGSSREELLNLISDLGYQHSITEHGITYTAPQYDVLCLP